MFRKLQIRLTVICACITSAIVVAMAVVSFSFSAQQIRLQNNEHFQILLDSIFSTLRAHPIIDQSWLLETELAEGVSIGIQNPENQLLLTELNPLRSELLAMAGDIAIRQYGFAYLAKPETRTEPDAIQFHMRSPHGRYRTSVARLPVDNQWLSVIVVGDLSQEQARIGTLFWAYTGCVLAAIACLIAFSWIFTGRAVHPIEVAEKKQRNFVSAASHELRSPLAVMNISAENILDAPTVEDAKQYAAIILRTCGRLAHLNEDLLQLANADSKSWQIHFQPINPEFIVLNAVESFVAVARKKHISLKADLPDASMPQLSCDKQRMEQVLSILLDNAVQYTPPGGKIIVAIGYRKPYVYIRVMDSGPGIRDEKKLLVFDRFYQGDPSRSKQDHYGLGLSIASEIIRLHKGQIQVEDAPIGGAAFTIRLPAGPPFRQ